MARWLLTLFGVALVLVALWDIVQELFFMDAVGTISRLVVRGLWFILRRVGRRFRGAIIHAGPIMVMCVALTWMVLLGLGGAFVYWPRLTDSFSPNSNVPIASAHSFGTALYISLASMSTLGSAEITPISWLVRAAIVIESFIGLVIFTAWITWMLSISPVIAERRSFARQIELLRNSHASPRAAARETPPESVIEVMRSLIEQVMRITAQLRQSHVSYYFQNDKREETLVRQLPWVLTFAREATHADGPPALHHRADMLCGAIAQLLGTLGEEYLELPKASPDDILRALAADHLLEEALPSGWGTTGSSPS